MNDVECPYCEGGVNINHDDGYGLEEDEVFSQECPHCLKVFAYTVSISVDHEAHRADCLNGGEHVWEKTHTYPVEYTKLRCATCGEEKLLPADGERINKHD
jgi:hypothetical protein